MVRIEAKKDMSIYSVDGVNGHITGMHVDGSNILVHTEVDPAERGRGQAKKMTKEVLDWIVAEKQQFFPICPFLIHYLMHHTEYDSAMPPRVREVIQERRLHFKEHVSLNV